MVKRRYTDEELYQMYVTLGEDRSLQRLADTSGYSISRLQKLSANGKWRERLANSLEEDKNLIKALVSDKSLANVLLESEVYKGMSETILKTLKESMLLLKPSDNPRDLKTFLDIYRVINGQATDISKQEIHTISEEQVRVLTDEELAAIPDTILENLLN